MLSERWVGKKQYNCCIYHILTPKKKKKKDEIGLLVISTEILAWIIAGKGFKHLEKHKQRGERRERERGRETEVCTRGRGNWEGETKHVRVCVGHYLRERLEARHRSCGNSNVRTEGGDRQQKESVRRFARNALSRTPPTQRTTA